jgi:hypothetical protein
MGNPKLSHKQVYADLELAICAAYVRHGRVIGVGGSIDATFLSGVVN